MNEAMSERADLIFTGVPEGLDALVLARLVEEAAEGERAGIVLHVARDDRRLEALEGQLRFFAPKVRVVPFPAWDTVPYDRVGPNPEIVAKRITALSRLALGNRSEPLIVLTTVNAVLQRVPPRAFIRNAMKSVAPGQRVDLNRFVARLSLAGYTRTGTVMEAGEFAVRGGILDLFPPGRQNPVRFDFFGDTLESIKVFDAETQRTAKPLRKLIVMPVSEVAFGEAPTALFRSRYVELFGGATGDDPLYEAVSAGSRYGGQEHWLPLFHETLETLTDYMDGATLSFDNLVDDAVKSRFEQVSEHYLARTEGLEAQRFGAPPYKPVPPDMMFLDAAQWGKVLAQHKVVRLTPFEMTEGPGVRPWRGRAGRSFAPERQNPDANVFDAVVAHVKKVHAEHRRVLVAAWTPGARERLSSLLSDHGLKAQAKVEGYADALALDPNVTGLAVLGLEQGFETPELAVIAEQDILGDRLVRPRRKAKRAADVLTEATSLSVGDLVVHADHGIGRFHGLKTITALGAPHDCLELKYAGGDTLYLPVENIELLSRYGSDDGTAQLDKLGGVAWQSRKAKLKKRLREMAAELIKIAALRQLREAPVLAPPAGAYDEFVARFPYEETEDQAASIDAVLGDLQAGRPMDRLVCGDVGFGKTEVALRAAFVAAMNGLQVAIVVPTTLLARQHSRTVNERFKNLPLKIAQASRLVSAKDLTEVKDGLKNGTIDIVVGTHALLGKQIEFQRLGLLVIDEEQHFGVSHKERLKQLREDVHVLTLSATPIPRTLQLALTGVRELSLITTPPVDRLAVRTYISQFDPVILIDALKRERDRGGQTYYVAPRISDLDDVAEFLREAVPHLKVARAHGQLAPSELEDVMTAFYEGQYDVLLSTAIVESGLDVPNANTLIVHRADMFGLAALYQLRGRVGRSKRRAYAYFTTPPGQKLTEGAEKRLKVLQSLDTLGAGFSLASHDLDIRGAGNLLGEEQSGHIREVGFELYQSMLEEAVAAMKGGDLGEADERWSPEISIGLSVLIPETYVADLQLRLGLYRRLSALETRSEIDAFAAELVDRFGELPAEVDHLLDVMEIKGLCRAAGIAKVDAGPKGAVIVFHRNAFANAQGLAQFLQASRGLAKLQPDHKLIFKGDWDQPQVRFKGVRGLVAALAEIAAKGAKAA
ncbi:MAG TPA: transcription-repair coupling factor [Hyphomicrobium zavarzinii]|jgi:transcription-repair coupling factor (superfamily II helicase)|uniref:transcription-repair coupling factor n=1 Tax=Hyphomicrobium sp. DMF-1 TaxID=3019544 RepID=UPI0022EC01C9|nr:transcription-repair coupling factor [Hyphomicrobium sp. DMF-1]WBT40356.1 transcription-repair coupling factor [Hyphomicrobium sp. DMF-1]HML43942.1 transcription-repair coupling factor [Hyphomicrobium zavarzinii]